MSQRERFVCFFVWFFAAISPLRSCNSPFHSLFPSFFFPRFQNWEESYYACGGIVYIIDVNDTDRWPESKTVLDQLLDNQQLAQIPIVVLGNKMDIMGSRPEHEVKSFFQFQVRTCC